MQYILGARELDELNADQIFWIIDGLNHISHNSINVSEYFSDLEIRKYSALKYEYKKPEKYPFIIKNVLQVADDQWVAVVDVNFLKEMYDKQLIVYNPNTQRELKKVTRNGNTFYSIKVNNKSVTEITNLLLSNQFIPNALSFNLSIDNPNVEFDVRNNSIIILGGQLDIIDGYHRFKAAIEAKALDDDFNYPFIMEIMNFDETKACAYIAQEDKRNKLSLDYSKSLDATNPTMLIVDRINSSPASLLKGLVGKEGMNVVNKAHLFGVIDYFYDTKKLSRSELVRTANYLISIINMCIDSNPKYLESISLTELAIIICGTTQSRHEDVCFDKIIHALKNNIHVTISSASRKNMRIIEKMF